MKYSRKFLRIFILLITLNSIDFALADGYDIPPLTSTEYNKKCIKEMYMDNKNYTDSLHHDLSGIITHEYEVYDENECSKVLKITINDTQVHGSILTFTFNPSNKDVEEVMMPDIISSFAKLGVKVSSKDVDKECIDGIALSVYNTQCSIRMVSKGLIDTKNKTGTVGDKHVTITLLVKGIKKNKLQQNKKNTNVVITKAQALRLLVRDTSELYAAGDFTNNNNQHYVARWDGINWQQLGAGFNDWIETITIAGNNIYAAGDFTNNNNQPYVARWDGLNWQQLGTGFNDGVNSIAIAGNNIYVAGNFTNNNNQQYVARWDGINWQQLGAGFNDLITTITIAGNNIYAAGDFTNNNNQQYVARWNGLNWQQLGAGLNAMINTISIAGNNIYAAGNFINNNNQRYVARWNGINWQQLGAGFNDIINTTSISGNNVYVAGDFTNNNQQYVARWDGINWQQVGTGFNGDIRKLISVRSLRIVIVG